MANNVDASQFEGKQAVMSTCIHSDHISDRGRKKILVIGRAILLSVEGTKVKVI